MRSPQPESVTAELRHEHIIKVKLRDVNQLFNSMDQFVPQRLVLAPGAPDGDTLRRGTNRLAVHATSTAYPALTESGAPGACRRRPQLTYTARSAPEL
jgi:hypothetical protein